MSRQLKSHFETHCVTNDIVFITDQDIGCSVTNDAEAVCQHINCLYPNKRIVYRDTDGRWDELIHRNGVFTNFAPYVGAIPDP